MFLSLLSPVTARAQIFFDLPPQSLAEALTSVGRLAHLNIYFDSSLVDGRQAAAVKGALSVDEALTHLLAGTHLHAVRVEANTVRIVADPPDKPAQGAGAPEMGTKQPREAKPPPPTAATHVTVGPKQQGPVVEVTVTGHYEFLSVDTSGTTNLPLPIEKVPQSISLVSDDFIKAADLNSLAAIAAYTPGAINEGNQLGLGTLIKIRGFTPGIAVDSIDIQGGTWFEPDNAIFERLEIVKGPSSVVYGISSPGGLVNYVTKSATPRTPDYLYARAGRWNSFRLEGQVAGALDPDGHIRAIGVMARDQGDSFMNILNHATTTVYGGINVDPGQAFSAYLHGGFERSERTAFDGVPTESDGTPAPVGRSFCICASGLDLTTNVYHAEADLTWHATGLWDVSVKGNYQSSRTSGIIPYSFGLATNGNVGLGLETFNPDNNHNYGVGVSSLYRLDDTGLRASFVSLAALYQDNRQTLRNFYYPEDPNDYPSVNIFSGQAAVSQAFYRLAASPLKSFDLDLHERVATISGQSVL
ncbi:MAG TPA: TonB-dependent receptor plug domain-containing protein, partial [Steroidobacteraceae bacterium]